MSLKNAAVHSSPENLKIATWGRFPQCLLVKSCSLPSNDLFQDDVSSYHSFQQLTLHYFHARQENYWRRDPRDKTVAFWDV